VSNAPREHRMDRASERGIEQRAEVAAMHAAERIVITPVRGALKYDTSELCGDRNKAKRFTDGRRWQLSIEDALQKFDSAGRFDILWRRHPRSGQSRANRCLLGLPTQ